VLRRNALLSMHAFAWRLCLIARDIMGGLEARESLNVHACPPSRTGIRNAGGVSPSIGQTDSTGYFRRVTSHRSRHTPSGSNFSIDGRSPGSRVSASPCLPGPGASGIVRRRSPLTVAGAATVSVPFGYASPCSLFIPGVVLPEKPSVMIISGKNGQGNRFHLPRSQLVKGRYCSEYNAKMLCFCLKASFRLPSVPA
jgi:hypothetical protein